SGRIYDILEFAIVTAATTCRTRPSRRPGSRVRKYCTKRDFSRQIHACTTCFPHKLANNYETRLIFKGRDVAPSTSAVRFSWLVFLSHLSLSHLLSFLPQL